MPRPFLIDQLPSKVRTLLLARCAETPTPTLNDHVQWLAERGHRVSRSAIARYLASLSASSAAEHADATDTEARAVRLGCLMVAASHTSPGCTHDLITTATALVNWVTQPETQA